MRRKSMGAWLDGAERNLQVLGVRHMASQKSVGAWLDAATRLGLRAPSFGPFASRPDEVCISLVAYEEADWIDALLNNALSMTRARIALHLNRASSYNAADIARWNVSRVAVNPHASSCNAAMARSFTRT